jgi:LacI family transcriptional regulator
MSNSTSDKCTIYDVAHASDVSIATVSRVLNGSPHVADATRDRVLQAARDLQYRPNRTAKSLAQPTTHTIAVAVPTFTTPFHSELLKGVRTCLDDADLDLLLCDLDWEDPESTLLTFLDRGAMDGLLLVGVPMTRGLSAELKTLGAPVVVVGAQWPSLDAFYWEEETGARLATEHLVERGHTRIGMITTPHATPIRDGRIEGYRQALAAADLPFDADCIAYGRTSKHDGFSEESGYEAMQDLIALNPPVTAVFASSDVQAIGAWQAIRHAGQRVPDDYALVGYDDVKVSRFIGLTSVAQNMHDVGEDATDVLLDRLRGVRSDAPVSRLVEPTLHVRAST